MNSNRSLGLKAAILSPSSASFGGSAHSSSGVLEAVIIDDDGTDQSLFLTLSHTANLHACSLVHSCDGNTCLSAKSSFMQWSI